MPRSQPNTFLIKDPRQLAALASPLRQEIIDAAEAAGPCSIADLARWVGRPPDRLYFHIRRLIKVGLLVECGRRREGRTDATLYRLPARRLRLHYGVASPANRRALTAIAGGVLRLAGRDFRRALSSGRAVVDGPGRDTWAGRTRGWLTPAHQRRFNRLLAEMQSILRAGRADDSAPRNTRRRGVAFTFVLVPVESRTRSERTSR